MKHPASISFVFTFLIVLFTSSVPSAKAYQLPDRELLLASPPASPQASATKVTGGSNHTCALTTTGGVKCWGNNSGGQLGDGTTAQRLTPVDVSGLSSGVIAIAAGNGYTCALMATGGVKCWGWNGYGMLGDGTTTNRTLPTDVVGLTSGVSAIVTGNNHTCALMAGGGVKCWGRNSYGKLGDGTTTNRTLPTDVVGLTSGVNAIATGYDHTCAVLVGGGAKCWGWNYHGQLGDGTNVNSSTPVVVSGITSTMGAIIGGVGHSCGLTVSGSVQCWGGNVVWQLGDGTLTSGVNAIAAGLNHTCALTATGSVKCWGYNYSGQLGDGTTTSSPLTDVIGLSGINAIGAGSNHSCAIMSNGNAICWGVNGSGQLGDGTANNYRTAPIDANGFGGTMTYSISGRITDSNNAPISGVNISNGAGHTTTTDSNGYFIFVGLPPGFYSVLPSKNNYSFSPGSRAITLPRNKTGQDFQGIMSVSQSCAVPFFSQKNDQWRKLPLRTKGACSPSCSTIGACGCTLTSAAMIFAYYGANLNPPGLSDCMGNLACPFYWGTGASCSGSKATWVGKYGFSWSRLDQEVNQNHRPVILGMHKKANKDVTHWVVVVSGQGSDPANYFTNDPLRIDGTNVKLSDLAQIYDFDVLSVYAGTPACGTAMPIDPRLGPVASRVVSAPSSSVVTGDVLVYRADGTTMTIQLIGQSTAGNVTEMMVWTDTTPNSTWQPVANLVTLPVSDIVYAQFRDEFANVSELLSDTLYPASSPSDQLLEFFLPFITK